EVAGVLDGSFRLVSLIQNIGTERERQRALLPAWENALLYALTAEQPGSPQALLISRFVLGIRTVVPAQGHGELWRNRRDPDRPGPFQGDQRRLRPRSRRPRPAARGRPAGRKHSRQRLPVPLRRRGVRGGAGVGKRNRG